MAPTLQTQKVLPIRRRALGDVLCPDDATGAHTGFQQ
jgi:hypothetical protein